MKKVDTLQDLSTLTTIPYSNLQKLFYRLGTIIAYDVQEAIKTGEQISTLDIGFGTLNIKVTTDDVSYKFIPSSTFEQDIVRGVLDSDIKLVNDVEESLRNRILTAYKDLM